MDDSIKQCKPPNVLIFSPLPSTDGSSTDFNVIKHDVQSCLGLHHYVIYPLTDIDQPWKDNCSLLIIPSSAIITPHDWNEISSYLTSGGKCLSINQQINDSFDLSSTANTDDVIKIVPSSSDDIDESHYYTVPISYHESCQSVLPIIDDTISSSDLANDGSDSCIKMLSSDKFKFVLVLSNVHLFSPQTYSSNKGLDCVAKMKESAPSRYHFITSTLTRMGLTCDDGHVPHLTHLYAITHNDRLVDELISSLHSYNGGHESSILVVGEMSSSLFILDDFNIGTPVDPIPPTTDAQVTILVKPSLCDVTSLDFNGECYFSSLTSVKLGRLLLVGPVMTSSQTMFSGNIPLNDILSNDMGLVCTPGQQTKGKGRGGNVWLSPKGCMMFSCPLKFPVLSNISKKASIIQHIVALSVVTAIRTIPGYEVSACLVCPGFSPLCSNLMFLMYY
jgi:biotin--protein ligase